MRARRTQARNPGLAKRDGVGRGALPARCRLRARPGRPPDPRDPRRRRAEQRPRRAQPRRAAARFAALKDEIGALLVEGAKAGAFGRFDLDVAVLVVLGGVRMAAHSSDGDRDVADAVADFLLTGL